LNFIIEHKFKSEDENEIKEKVNSILAKIIFNMENTSKMV